MNSNQYNIKIQIMQAIDERVNTKWMDRVPAKGKDQLEALKKFEPLHKEVTKYLLEKKLSQNKLIELCVELSITEQAYKTTMPIIDILTEYTKIGFTLATKATNAGKKSINLISDLNEEIKLLPKKIKSAEAKKSANVKHEKTTYVKKNQIIAYWHKNIGKNVSNELAAEQLLKIFPDIAHRTLVKYVSEAKKLPSAGTT